MQIAVKIRREERLQDLYTLKGIDTLEEALETLTKEKALQMIQRQITIISQGLFRDYSQADCEKWFEQIGIKYTYTKDNQMPEPKASGLTPEQKELRDYMKVNSISLDELKAFRLAQGK